MQDLRHGGRLLVVLLIAAIFAEGAHAQDLGHGFTKNGRHIFFKGRQIDSYGPKQVEKLRRLNLGQKLELCRDVDAESFQVLSNWYSKDKHHVYLKREVENDFWVTVIQDADPATFKLLDDRLGRDKRHVWALDKFVKDADPRSATLLRKNGLWKDRNHVYYLSGVLKSADSKSFRHLDHSFYRDGSRVFFGPGVIVGADVNSFRTFGDVPYAADKNSVWFGGAAIPDIDPATFELLQNHVFRDANGVYYGRRAKPIPEAKAKSFRKAKSFKDKRYILFDDGSKSFVFDSKWEQMFVIQRTDSGLVARRDIWLRRPNQPPVQAASVRLELQDGSFTAPQLLVKPRFVKLPPPTSERDQILRLKPILHQLAKDLPRPKPR